MKAVMELEFHQLVLKYQTLRVVTAGRQARLVASLMQHGQQSPVLVVQSTEGYVLVDGYRRVKALGHLGYDTVQVTVLDISEADALVLSYRLETNRRRSVLEEAWLLRELCDTHGKKQQELAVLLGRSPSWVSRRLALVRKVPESVEMLVRKGCVCAHAAMKYLVPLARANIQDCESLVLSLDGQHLSERQVGKLYAGWRAADTEGRYRIVTEPLLYLAVEDETSRADEPAPGEEQERALVRDMSAVSAICRRARKAFIERASREKSLPWPSVLRLSWQDAQSAFALLVEVITKE